VILQLLELNLSWNKNEKQPTWIAGQRWSEDVAKRAHQNVSIRFSSSHHRALSVGSELFDIHQKKEWASGQQNHAKNLFIVISLGEGKFISSLEFQLVIAMKASFVSTEKSLKVDENSFFFLCTLEAIGSKNFIIKKNHEPQRTRVFCDRSLTTMRSKSCSISRMRCKTLCEEANRDCFSKAFSEGKKSRQWLGLGVNLSFFSSSSRSRWDEYAKRKSDKSQNAITNTKPTEKASFPPLSSR
jgi:hypothetical protein